MVMGAHAAPLVRAPGPAPTPRPAAPLVLAPGPAPTPRPTSTSLLNLALLLLVLTSSHAALSFGQTADDDALVPAALLRFKSSITNAGVLTNWNPDSTSPCLGDHGSWTGVLCDKGKIWGLQLENMGLGGKIDLNSLVPLSGLRSLSFMNNEFDGPMPDVRKLGALKSLFLSNNRFSGQIPDDAFRGMASLKKVYLANNNFTGKIPSSVAESPRLLELRLENNHFIGQIPDFHPDLNIFNVSNNQLEGPIPPSLRKMDPSSFSGNQDLCGEPLDSVCKSTSPPLPQSPSPLMNIPSPPLPLGEKKKSSSPLRTVGIVIACLVVLAVILMLIILLYRSRSSQTPQLGRTVSPYNHQKSNLASANHTYPVEEHASSSPGLMISGVAGGHSSNIKGSGGDLADQQNHSTNNGGKLSFVRDDRQRFDLQDLLRASAEVLGSGSFGSSYKAVLMEGQAVVVKRFKQMNNVGKEEFHEHMRRIGRLKHPNLLPLVAYYYRKEEKLLVFDYVHNGSLASQLHSNHTAERPALDWPTRLKIAKGVAKGLAYLYSELPCLIVPHGHLKSTNVLLDESFEPLLMDYTLVPVVNSERAHHLLVAYKSPEYERHGRTTKKTDVWSMGVLILEMLTGKFPANYLVAQGSSVTGYGADLANMISSISNIVGNDVVEEVEGLFDKDMGSTENAGGQMVKLLKIGVACCGEDLERRLDLKEAVDKIQLLEERDD
ncbi:hypothetical protein RJ639_007638 [Escallonia herrerae]|uniref:Protein kinase domain-containing protein n=1 Tax=Escallonia herrerae TaxID=1293975 RepID=A0AA89AUN4_9ASTE|nr:hypothetical protein RJ639_007638 [Escallonia herrerae]